MKPFPILIADLTERGQIEMVRAITQKNGAHFENTWRGRRWRECARARAECWAILADLRTADAERLFTPSQIARLFGVDHTTILAAVRRLGPDRRARGHIRASADRARYSRNGPRFFA
jgi:hypothetical protein